MALYRQLNKTRLGFFVVVVDTSEESVWWWVGVMMMDEETSTLVLRCLSPSLVLLRLFSHLNGPMELIPLNQRHRDGCVIIYVPYNASDVEFTPHGVMDSFTSTLSREKSKFHFL